MFPSRFHDTNNSGNPPRSGALRISRELSSRRWRSRAKDAPEQKPSKRDELGHSGASTFKGKAGTENNGKNRNSKNPCENTLITNLGNFGEMREPATGRSPTEADDRKPFGGGIPKPGGKSKLTN